MKTVLIITGRTSLFSTWESRITKYIGKDNVDIRRIRGDALGWSPKDGVKLSVRLLSAQMLQGKALDDDVPKDVLKEQILDQQFDQIFLDEIHEHITPEIEQWLRNNKSDIIGMTATPWGKSIIQEICTDKDEFSLLDHRRKILAGGLEGHKLKDHPWFHAIKLQPKDKDTKDLARKLGVDISEVLSNIKSIYEQPNHMQFILTVLMRMMQPGSSMTKDRTPVMDVIIKAPRLEDALILREAMISFRFPFAGPLIFPEQDVALIAGERAIVPGQISELSNKGLSSDKYEETHTRFFDPENWSVDRPRKYLIVVDMGHTGETYPTVNCPIDLAGINSPRLAGQFGFGRGGTPFATDTFRKRDDYFIAPPHTMYEIGLEAIRQQKRKDKAEGRKSDWTLNELMGFENFDGMTCDEMDLDTFLKGAGEQQDVNSLLSGLEITADAFKDWSNSFKNSKFNFGDNSGEGSTGSNGFGGQKGPNTDNQNISKNTKKMMRAITVSLLQIEAEKHTTKTFTIDHDKQSI
jgi:hypothetical protein